MNYPNTPLDNRATTPNAGHERVLHWLKTQGPASTAEVASGLGITAEAARQQVQRLVAEGWLVGETMPARGAGRPRRAWTLTEAGHGRFPDAHPQLTVQLIGSIRQLFGEDGLDRLIAQRAADTRLHYKQAIDGLPSLSARVQKLAEIRSAEGYMARVERDGDDWLLIEDHCPICAAAKTCQGFCRSELELFQELIGERGTVSRETHILAGGQRCTYRVSPC
ncbi:transcriptional regulator [Pandoraea pulmonicola]|uniref:Transcriptional regulator n=1 Tax=Pandoraea pulmonicola TaxID=93221 RepID=A0AAJ4ZFT8_PANPU|nr:metalloregulator ArsR/SmtB family transcription factor [Pandoraea pulmonicola]AJC19435.1 transcriptional regulator [Pandoraea pulmonicola]SUA92544.1 iron-sulfur cluster biosynthesis transcriptional regulator SufR [Pandoraea pulmonicola]